MDVLPDPCKADVVGVGQLHAWEMLDNQETMQHLVSGRVAKAVIPGAVYRLRSPTTWLSCNSTGEQLFYILRHVVASLHRYAI
jgi:hypothetical protein